jgi:hypothetical protein
MTKTKMSEEKVEVINHMGAEGILNISARDQYTREMKEEDDKSERDGMEYSYPSAGDPQQYRDHQNRIREAHGMLTRHTAVLWGNLSILMTIMKRLEEDGWRLRDHVLEIDSGFLATMVKG